MENLALRQQLAVFKRKRSRPRIGPGDRMLWVLLRSVWRNWANAFIVFNQRQLHRVVSEFVTYYQEDRCHLSLEKDAPEPRAVTPQPSPLARVVALPKVGWLQHRHEWREAA